MNQKISTFLLFLLLGMWGFAANLPSHSELEKEIPLLMKNNLIPGLSIAVIKDGKITWHGEFGVKNKDTNAPVTEETVFEAASLSKPVTAYCALRFAEAGKLDLDKPVIDYVGEKWMSEVFLKKSITDNRLREITTRMILAHTSGFPNWRRGELKLMYDPGKGWSYSGEAYQLLGFVLEKIEGSTLDKIMDDYVIKPLGMDKSSFAWRPAYDSTAVSGHDPLNTRTRLGKPFAVHAAGSLMTTAVDYAKFIAAIMNNTGLKAGTVKDMLTTHSSGPDVKDPRITWGLGFALQHSAQSGPSFWHTGDNIDIRNFAMGFKNERTGVVFFTNSYYGLSIVREIIDLAIGGNHPAFESSFMTRYYSPFFEFSKKWVTGGSEAALKFAGDLYTRSNGKVKLSGIDMNRFGYTLLSRKDYEGAIKVFHFNVKMYPVANAYDSLAEGYLKMGDRKNALKYYRKALELDPNLTSAVNALKKLGDY